MKLVKTLKIGKAVIDIWQDDDGTIIVGGHHWYEYNDYESLEKLRQTRKVAK